MRPTSLMILTLAIGVLMAAPAQADRNLIQIVAEGCKTELESYCKDVKPGDGRVLACLYAHEDKISGQCEYALFDAAAQLERAIGALVYVTNECGNDMVELCGQVRVGEGRVLDCLKKNDAKVSDRCKAALKDTGLDEYQMKK